MRVIRGTNVYPSAVEGVVRRYPELREFRIVLTTVENIDEITVEIEPVSGVSADLVETIAGRLKSDLADAHEGLRFGVTIVAESTLPVFELKARRLLDRRAGGTA
jgi:phenylacetate-CoA ligase